jgi:hypothetical protein
VASLLPDGVNPDAFSYQQRYVDAIYRTLRGVNPGDYDDYNIYLVQWLGSNVPRGVTVEGKTIDGVQHGVAYHLVNPQADASDWVWEELGSYERVYDDAPDRDGSARHGLLLYVRKPAPATAQGAATPS